MGQTAVTPVIQSLVEYSFSNTFSMLSDQNQLQDVLQILKRIGAIVSLA